MRLNFFAVFLLLISLEDTVAAKYKVTSEIYISVKYDEQILGKILIGLFGEDAPKTVENFRQICLKGINGKTYVDSIFHRVIKKFVIQGGDIVTNNGDGSISIYGKYFEDENLHINHTGSGFVAMANKGPDTNGCQFYITTMSAPWLNGKHTIFGKVVDGQNVVHAIEKVKTDTDDYPVKPVIITECGDSSISSPYVISDDPYDLWAWIKASSIPLGMSFSILAFFQFIIRKLDQFH